jgi:hypothetical protein
MLSLHFCSRSIPLLDVYLDKIQEMCDFLAVVQRHLNLDSLVQGIHTHGNDGSDELVDPDFGDAVLDGGHLYYTSPTRVGGDCEPPMLLKQS